MRRNCSHPPSRTAGEREICAVRLLVVPVLVPLRLSKDDELHLCYRLTRLQDFVNTDATKAYFDEASHNWKDSWTRALAWEYQQAFTSADFDDVFFQGHAIGRVRTSHGLSFMKVYGAGHMVPHDQPAASYEIVRSFLYDAPGEGMFS
ncbi:Serine protease family S10 [Phytophthora cinnamomi]|uniref:Serine protease family S10 n=1 Tax=Phytophthora cinnamomi TaxID=4785 RepID=UPI003559B77A|nr:Serine protease family S10 [Phytophthora cinnamomi]